jgi:hypothetical protein
MKYKQLSDHCKNCWGLIAEPNKIYHYAGKFCHCTKPEPMIIEYELTSSTSYMNPPTPELRNKFLIHITESGWASGSQAELGATHLSLIAEPYMHQPVFSTEQIKEAVHRDNHDLMHGSNGHVEIQEVKGRGAFLKIYDPEMPGIFNTWAVTTAELKELRYKLNAMKELDNYEEEV